MKNNTAESDRWSACQGEVGYLVRQLRHRRRGAVMQRGVASALILLLGLYTSYFHVVVMADIDLHSGDLTCDQVMHGFHLFFSGVLGRETDIKFQRHLDHCSACRQRRDEHLRDNQYRVPSDKVGPVNLSPKSHHAGADSESHGQVPSSSKK